MARADALLARREAHRRRGEAERRRAVGARSASENAVFNAVYDAVLPVLGERGALGLTQASDFLVPGLGAAITAEDSLDILRDADSPLDYALGTALGGLALAETAPLVGKALGRGGRAALRGGLKGASDDVLAFIGDDYGGVSIPPKLRDDPYGFQATKIDRPNAEIEVRGEQVVDLLPERPATIEDLQGTAVLPIFGDRTSAGFSITGIDEMDFDLPVMTEGGRQFARAGANQADDAVWASGPAVMSGLRNRIRAVADETGLPVTGAHVTMAPNAADFTTFGGGVFSEMAKQSKITKSDVKAFNDAVRNGVGPFNPILNFPGIKHPELREWMMSPETKPDFRKGVIRRAEQSPWQRAGLPSPGKMRYATADEVQRSMPGQQAGLALLRFGDDMELIEAPQVPHSTYGVQGRGEYIGRMDPVAHTDMWRDFFSDPRVTHKGGKSVGPSNQLYTMKLNLPYQVIDQQMVDTLMEARNGGT